MKINDLNVSEEIIRAVSDMGFEEFSPIQEQAIPFCLEGRDIIGQSQTGTGKTAAFAIPILEKIDPKNRKPQALILCPTRELAVQVADEFKRIAKYKTGIRIVAVYGGEPINRQISALSSGAQIIIGTPGRTIDHITKRHTIKTSEISMVVLDEADEMLKMGFREDIELVLSSIPVEGRQTILFSATMPPDILAITKKYQTSPELVKVTQSVVTADTITQEYCEMKASHKFEALARILEVNRPTRCLVFCNTKNQVNEVADELMARGFSSEKIHGDLKQELRMSVLKKFNRSIINILVATDVAARGLDIKEVDLVINFDVPDKEDYYVHRIGRSGRAGLEGRAITLVNGYETRRLINIMHYTKHKIEKIKIPTMKQVNLSKTDAFIQEITETIQNENLDDYKEILNQIDTMYTIEDVCASLIKKNLELTQSLHDNDINFVGRETRERGSSRPRTDRDRGSRDSRPSSDRGGDRSSRPERSSERSDRPNRKRRDDKDMVRVFLNLGNKDDVMPKHILGAITNEAGIEGSQVGSIDVLERFSFVDIHQDVVKKVIKKLEGKTINDKKVAMEIATKSKK